jgi:hypothetical protein
MMDQWSSDPTAFFLKPRFFLKSRKITVTLKINNQHTHEAGRTPMPRGLETIRPGNRASA